jgi:hypothetical protein
MEIHEKSFCYEEYVLRLIFYLTYPGEIKNRGRDEVVAVGFGEELFADCDDFWKVEVIPGEFLVVYAGESGAESAAEFDDGSGRMFCKKFGAVTVEFAGAEAEAGIEFVTHAFADCTFTEGLMEW